MGIFALSLYITTEITVLLVIFKIFFKFIYKTAETIFLLPKTQNTTKKKRKQHKSFPLFMVEVTGLEQYLKWRIILYIMFFNTYNTKYSVFQKFCPSLAPRNKIERNFESLFS